MPGLPSGRHQTCPASLRGDIRHFRPSFGETSDIPGSLRGDTRGGPGLIQIMGHRLFLLFFLLLFFYVALRPQRPLGSIRDGVWGGSGGGGWSDVHNATVAMRTILHEDGQRCETFKYFINSGRRSHRTVRRSQLFPKRKESPSGLELGPFAYQPSALPLGQTCSLSSSYLPGASVGQTGSQQHV